MSTIAQTLLEWYRENARQLPWRENPSPYQTWVSEIMLQQTRVETVVSYYEQWMRAFPTLEDLAQASEESVLKAWEGLGYYSRARNLHKAAHIIVEQYAGKMPAERKALEKLPGIGEYTAGAVLSIAFGKDEPAVDGNVGRVFSRLFDIDKPIQEIQTKKLLKSLAEQHLPEGQAGAFNQALMDLGATVCTPKMPRCEDCPLLSCCLAHNLGIVADRPVPKERSPIPHHIVTAAIIRQDGTYLLAQRPRNGLLGGLWEFPGGKAELDEALPDCLKREIYEELGVEVNVGSLFGAYDHAYTHFKVTLHAFCCQIENGTPKPLAAPQIRWVNPEALSQLPMGKIDRQIANQLANGTEQCED